ncbi:MAG: hypothetical protein KAT05_12270, partial [Spirochaetes bacterium]|nr:hypothetical protein [Spirochaetota bacterium]
KRWVLWRLLRFLLSGGFILLGGGGWWGFEVESFIVDENMGMIPDSIFLERTYYTVPVKRELMLPKHTRS